MYRPVEVESDEFAKGELIETFPSRLKGRNTGFEPGEIYVVIAILKRWSRWKLTMGNKELEYCVSETIPEGEEWKRDFMYEIHPLFVKTFGGEISLSLKTFGSQRAAGFYFKKARMRKEEAVAKISQYFESLLRLINVAELSTEFQILADTLQLMSSQYKRNKSK